MSQCYEFLDLATFQQIPEVHVVDVYVPSGPVSANFVEQVVDVPLGPVSERIVEQVVDAPVARDSPTSGYAQQLDARTPAAWLGAPQEHFDWFFRTFSTGTKSAEVAALSCESAVALELVAGCSS